MTRLMPGVYDDHQGGLHIDMAELLTAAGYHDTPENRATLLAAARYVFGDCKITETDDPIQRNSDQKTPQTPER